MRTLGNHFQKLGSGNNNYSISKLFEKLIPSNVKLIICFYVGMKYISQGVIDLGSSPRGRGVRNDYANGVLKQTKNDYVKCERPLYTIALCSSVDV